MTTEEFVRRSRELHGGKYGYEKAVYESQRKKVIIHCRTCQRDFEQFPRKHYAQGEGCWDCGVAKRQLSQSLTFNAFVAKAQAKHGRRYEYDASGYTCAKNKLSIRCRECGDHFVQQGNSHLQGSGCPRCSMRRARIKQSYGYDGFLARARQTHGEKFTYLECTDRNWTQKSVVTWRCNDCGIIREQLVLNHLAGRGCAQCSGRLQYTLDTFVAKSQHVHGKDRYDYSEVVYVASDIPVWLTCNMCHFRFQTRPNNHLFGKECARCVSKRFVSKGETEWLDHLGVDPKDRNVWLKVGNRYVVVDGLVGNTVYEFDEDYYHGNPARFARDKVNHKCGMTMGELHDRTVKRRKELLDAGYQVVSIWESEWKATVAPKGRS